jgi:hypothetical protein
MIEEQQDIEGLRGDVAAREREVAKLEAEIAELEREIDDFQGVYQQNVGFAESRLDGAKVLLSQLERERAEAYNPVASSGYMSVEEQFRQRWHRPVEEPPPLPEKPQTLPETLSPADLKQMYRKLARLYHPDFAADEADRQRRTRLMALINEAYEAGDLQALRILEKGVPEDSQVDVRQLQTDQSLAILELHQLRQAGITLARQVAALKGRRSELLNSAWMSMKVEEKLLRLRGRDMFKELIASFDREFEEIRAKIDRLKALPEVQEGDTKRSGTQT